MPPINPKFCHLCNLPLTPIEEQACIKYGIDFSHARCVSKHDMEVLANQDVKVPQYLYDKLNLARLLIIPNLELSSKGNEYESEINTQKWLDGASFEMISLAMIKAQSVAAACQYLISKSRKDILIEVAERDKEHFANVREIRQKQSDKHDPIKSAVDREEKEKLSKYEKDLRRTMKVLGCSKSEAVAYIKEAHEKAAQRGKANG